MHSIYFTSIDIMGQPKKGSPSIDTRTPQGTTRRWIMPTISQLLIIIPSRVELNVTIWSRIYNKNAGLLRWIANSYQNNSNTKQLNPLRFCIHHASRISLRFLLLTAVSQWWRVKSHFGCIEADNIVIDYFFTHIGVKKYCTSTTEWQTSWLVSGGNNAFQSEYHSNLAVAHIIKFIFTPKTEFVIESHLKACACGYFSRISPNYFAM